MATQNLIMDLIDTLAGRMAGQDTAQAMHGPFDMLPLGNSPATAASLLICFALVVWIGLTARPVIAAALRIGWRALVYLFKRICIIVVDRLLEALIVALIAVMAGISWLTDIAAALGRIFP